MTMRFRIAPNFLLLLLLLVSPAAVQGTEGNAHAKLPVLHKRIYIANDDHTDYFWMGTDEDYREAFIAMLDFYMDQAESTALVNPPHARGRFSTDGSLWVWEYEHNKTPAEFDRLVEHMRDGTITMPLHSLILNYGAMPAEAVLRDMYYAGRLERREGLSFPLVVPMENQVLPGGVASLWAGSGALYAWKGICSCATKIDAAYRPREIYHFTGPDGQSVCMKWNSMRNYSNQSIGGYAEARYPYEIVAYLDSNPGFLSVWPWPVSAAFGYGWDDLASYTDLLIQAARDLGSFERRVVVSNEIDFFEDFLAAYRDSIPSFSGSFGNEWDLYTASMAAVTGAFRRGIEKLRTAEVLAVIASLHDPDFMGGREEARDRAFLAAGLYYEHDWTADGPVGRDARAAFQRAMLSALESYVNALYDDGIGAVGSLIPQEAGTERFFVMNPLSWVRTDYADLPTSLSAPAHVMDITTGLEVPSQFITREGVSLLRIRAADVPAVGYRVYEVVPGEGAAFPPSATVVLPSFDNGIYGVTLGARGEITSLMDHKNGDRELVAGGSALHDLGHGSGSAVLEEAGPVSTTLLVAAGGSPPHEERITLYAGIDRIDIEGRVTGNFSRNLGFTSQFALTGIRIRHEEVGMIAEAARASAGGDYADENTRTDYLTLNHFVDLSETAYGITVSARESPFFRAGTSTVDFLDSTTPRIRAVVGMQVDGPALGIQNQGGDSLFASGFALRTHGPYDQAAAMRMALEHQNPLVAGSVTGLPSAPLPAETFTLLSLDGGDVLLWALKPAEEGIGDGIIARLWNLAEGSREFVLTLHALDLAGAARTTHIETDIEQMPVIEGSLADTLAAEGMRTYRLFPEGLALRSYSVGRLLESAPAP